VSEARKIAALPAGSQELASFNERVSARVIEARRALDKMLDTPPEFGRRGTGDAWISLLSDLARQPGFDKSLTRSQSLSRALRLLSGQGNPWADRLARWGLYDLPYGVVAQASPDERVRLDADRVRRVHTEEARLMARFGTADLHAALGLRAKEIDDLSKAVEDAEASVPMPPLTSTPPMTDDDTLVWSEEMRHGVTVVTSTFESMKSATVGLALRLDGVADSDLVYVAALAKLISDVGVIHEGVPIPYGEVRDRLRREVLGVHVYTSVSYPRQRAEIVFEASGNDEDESRRALSWVSDMLESPDWREANLARLRDVANEEATSFHDVMAGAEEHWVERTEEAYWRQNNPVLAHAGSSLSRAYDAYRLSWMLEEPPADPRLASFLGRLSHAGGDRAALEGLARSLGTLDASQPAAGTSPDSLVSAARALPTRDRPTLGRVGRDLGQLLMDVPDASLSADWADLCRQLASDMTQPPSVTLAGLERTLAALRRSAGARVWVVGSSRHQAAIRPALDQMLRVLHPSGDAPSHAPAAHVLERARGRGAMLGDASVVALVNRSTANAAMVGSAPLATYDDPTDAAVVDFLAANVFNGSGAHSFYKRVWGSGLAYSGYTWASPRYGRYKVYTDRCADLPQLLRFLGSEVAHAPADARFADYSIARAFSSRGSDTFEARARAIVADLADGFPPQRVRAFRGRLLGLRGRAGLVEAMHARLLPVYGAILPTLPAPSPAPRDSLVFAVGPEAVVSAFEREIQESRGAGQHVLRLYPRDFWYPGEAALPFQGQTNR